MANTIAKSSTVQPKVPRFNRPALCFFLFFYFFRKRKGKQCAGFFQGIRSIVDTNYTANNNNNNNIRTMMQTSTSVYSALAPTKATQQVSSIECQDGRGSF